MLDNELHALGFNMRERRRMIGSAVVMAIFLSLLPALDQGSQQVMQSITPNLARAALENDRATLDTVFLAPSDGYAAAGQSLSDTVLVAIDTPLPKGRYAHIHFKPLIHKAARRYAIDPKLISAIIKAESNFNPQAVSYRGAQGLMQLMPATARSLGVEDSFNPEHNINGGVRYFKRLMNRFDGDTRLALAAYNAGSTKVRRYNGVPPYKQTRTYIRKVLAYYQAFKSEGKQDDRA